MRTLPLLLLALVVALAVYDFHTRRLPNWATLPPLLAGVLLGFPGSAEIWLGCLLLFTGWRIGALGGGDTKLWMALLWLGSIPGAPAAGGGALMVMGASLTVSALLQILWRWARGWPLLGVQAPGAWRAVPFALWLLAAG